MGKLRISIKDVQHNRGDQNTEADKLDALLVKEMEETNNWARLGAQLYFGWFTLLLTVNGFATGWLFSGKDTTGWLFSGKEAPLFARWIFFTFAVLDLLGTVATIRIRKHLGDSDRRVTEVIKNLTHHATAGTFMPLSPVPRGAIKTALGFTGLALIALTISWLVLAIFALGFAI